MVVSTKPPKKKQIKDKKFDLITPGIVRTRFAPAPTGFLHIGSARTALFNYLFAKKYQGSFILRIENTDKERSKPQFEKDIIENLKWLGIHWDEGPTPISLKEIGEFPISLDAQRRTPQRVVFQFPKKEENKYIGNYGPYHQSKRGHIYKKYLEKLLKEGKAYYCFCTPEELEAKKQYQISVGTSPHYDGKCANLSLKDVKKNLKEGKKYIIRFKVSAKKVEINDMVRGKIEFDTGLIGDMAIAKDLTNPLYNFSVVVDDFEMKISHVLRGEDLLSNTPKQIILQEALGFPPPKYGHLPLILGLDRSKLSKRHGAISVSEYRNEGYLAETLINMLAFLGWNPGDEREIFSLPALIKEFSMEKVQKGGAIFNIQRLDFLNGFYIRQKSIDKLTELCIPFLIKSQPIIPIFEEQKRLPDFTKNFKKEIVQKEFLTQAKEKISFDYLKTVISIYQERLKKLSEIPELTDFFFKEKLQYEKELLRWKGIGDKEVLFVIDRLNEKLSDIKEKDWNAENLEKILLSEAEKTGSQLNMMGDRGHLLWPLRVALTGKKASAGPFEIAEILGKEKTLIRLGDAKAMIRKP